ncbi:MAG TPA: hypothetical protein DEQ38_06745 [Elusimicrobia bacterium]|nr:MAG: hypothetical protein A2089_05875 [Elusimicrobia bacterium GWD2_63_28]HCC47800.1 hypothetical protein [Elusimicrobiota bacterium]
MKLSDVKRRNRVIGIICAAVLFQAGGLDPRLRAIGGTAFSFTVLVLFFFLIPLAIEYLERKFTK